MSAASAVGLKNTLGIADELEPEFDFAIVEQCFYYRECGLLQPFIDAGKSVVVVEYELSRAQFCDQGEAPGRCRDAQAPVTGRLASPLLTPGWRDTEPLALRPEPEVGPESDRHDPEAHEQDDRREERRVCGRSEAAVRRGQHDVGEREGRGHEQERPERP